MISPLHPFLLVAPALLAGAGRLTAEELKSPDPARPVSYWKDIRPILQTNCHGCHQPAKAKGGYIMTDFAALVKGGDDAGTAVVPGKPDESSLVKNITPNAAGEVEMPKKGDPLKATEIALVRRWIEQGGTDDTPANARQVWDATHPPVYTQPSLISALDFSPDGQLLAVSGFHEVLLLETGTGTIAARLIGLSERIESVRFSPDGTRLAVTGGQPARMGEVQIWDVGTKKLSASVSATFDTLYGASWSPDGKSVVFGGADKSVRVINATSGEQTFFSLLHDDWVQDTTFSVKGDYIVSVGRDMTAKLSEIATQRFVDNITSITPGALKGGLQAVSRHPQRDEILVGGSDGEPRLYRLYREVERKIGDDSNLIRVFPAIVGRIWTAEYARDGQSFAVGGSLDGKGVVAFYGADVTSALPEELKVIFRKETTNRSAEERKKVEDYSRANVSKLREVILPTPIYALTFTHDGSQVACAGGDGHIRFVNVAEGAIVREFQPFPLTPTQAAN
jgi:WD40 repeat protein/mono/diheme cytochrome c family protein